MPRLPVTKPPVKPSVSPYSPSPDPPDPPRPPRRASGRSTLPRSHSRSRRASASGSMRGGTLPVGGARCTGRWSWGGSCSGTLRWVNGLDCFVAPLFGGQSEWGGARSPLARVMEHPSPSQHRQAVIACHRLAVLRDGSGDNRLAMPRHRVMTQPPDSPMLTLLSPSNANPSTSNTTRT